jgi:hypothetical protein
MSVRRAAGPKISATPLKFDQALHRMTPSPYFNPPRLGPPDFEDHDGDTLRQIPCKPDFKRVSERWVISPTLGAADPAICLFPSRLSKKVSFSNNLNLEFSKVFQPTIVRFNQLFLTDVDKRGNFSGPGGQNWVVSFKCKTNSALTIAEIRICVDDNGEFLKGWAVYFTDSDLVQSNSDFPPEKSERVGFDSSTAIVINSAFSTLDPSDATIVFSKLDRSVEYERRVERSRQAWKLFVTDIKMRSENTIESMNRIRQAVFYSQFQNKAPNSEFFEVDPERAP